MALSGHFDGSSECPLSGVKWTWVDALQMSAFDPKRTLRTVPTYILSRTNKSYVTLLRLALIKMLGVVLDIEAGKKDL